MDTPFFGIVVVVHLAVCLSSTVLHWKVIKASVIKKYFMLMNRGFFGTLSGIYVCVTVINFSISVSMLGGWKKVETGLENISATVESITNFAILLFLIDVFIGKYKNFFHNFPPGHLIFGFFCIFCFILSLVIPEFCYRGFDEFPPSHAISFGFSFVNFLINIITLLIKIRENKIRLFELRTRFVLFLGTETLKVMLFVTGFRFVVTGLWILFQLFSSSFSTKVHILAHVMFNLSRSVESLLFGLGFFIFHKRFTIFNQPPPPVQGPKTLAETMAEEQKRLDDAHRESERNRKSLSDSWNKAHRAMMRGAGRKKQYSASTSNVTLLREEAMETINE